MVDVGRKRDEIVEKVSLRKMSETVRGVFGNMWKEREWEREEKKRKREGKEKKREKSVGGIKITWACCSCSCSCCCCYCFSRVQIPLSLSFSLSLMISFFFFIFLFVTSWASLQQRQQYSSFHCRAELVMADDKVFSVVFTLKFTF